MFTIEDTSCSLSVSLPDRGYAIASGGTWHRTGLSLDDACLHVARLTNAEIIFPEATAEQIFALYYVSWFLATDIAANGVASLIS